MRARARPASLIAGWVHGGACHSGGGVIGPDRYRSAPIGPDRPRPGSFGLDRFRLVSVGLGRPRSVSVASDRPRSVSIFFGSNIASPRPIETDRDRSRPTDTYRFRPQPINADRDGRFRSRPIETDRDRSALHFYRPPRAERPPARPRVRFRSGTPLEAPWGPQRGPLRRPERAWCLGGLLNRLGAIAGVLRRSLGVASVTFRSALSVSGNSSSSG